MNSMVEEPVVGTTPESDLTNNNAPLIIGTTEISVDVEKEIKRNDTGQTVNTCRGCDRTLESKDGRSHWCPLPGCQNLKRNSHNQRRREKRQKQNENARANNRGINKPLPEFNYNANFLLSEKKKAIMESGAIVLRGFLTEIEAEVLYWHSSALQLQSERDGSSKTISGNYTEVDLPLPQKMINRRPLSSILEKVVGFAKSCCIDLFGNEPEMGLMYINKEASCQHQQLLHADSLFQSHIKMLICVTEKTKPTRYVPYDRLFGEPIRDIRGATRYRIADRFQEMLPVGPMLSVGRLYSRSLPVVASTFEMGDAMMFLGDFIHGGPNNPCALDRRMLFVNTWSNEGEKITKNNPLDRQMNIYTLMEILYEKEKDGERRKKTIEALSTHLHSNGSDQSQVKFHASNLSNGNSARYRADLRSLNVEIAKIKERDGLEQVSDNLLF
jgi:hypothetical protein